MGTQGQTHLVERLEVRFALPEAGWIRIHVAGLKQGGGAICCTHLADPFEEMLAWLEAIAQGSDLATWVVVDEGATNLLTFVNKRFLGSMPTLVVHRIGWGETLEIPCNGREIVQAFYCAFRTLVENPHYDAAEWEWSGDWRMCDNSLYSDFLSEDEEEAVRRSRPFDGSILASLRSSFIEDWLDGGGDSEVELPLTKIS